MPKVDRRVKRNIQQALKARTLREKKQVQHAFSTGVNLGADAMRDKILSATKGMEYEQGHYNEWCRNPKACEGLGRCPLDPTCAD
jgi:hypothetical protein